MPQSASERLGKMSGSDQTVGMCATATSACSNVSNPYIIDPKMQRPSFESKIFSLITGKPNDVYL